MTQVQIADTQRQVRRCHDVMVQLRPHLDNDTFAKQVRRQRKEGYRLAYVEAGGRVAAVAGYRIQHMLHQGRMLYVDDLVTDETRRSTGLGKRLMEWLVEEAKREGCDVLELDSGVQRTGAHRFYFGLGMHIASYHFRLPLNTPALRALTFMPPPPAARPATPSRALRKRF